MEESTMNHYEKQLYTVFKTFDVDNKEALDRSSVDALCDSLQLEGRGTELIERLFDHPSDRVTFAQFRNGLLSVLGADRHEAPIEPSTSDDADLEVAPRYVFGSKKYGRRSRPARPPETPSTPRAASASRLDTEQRRARHRPPCRRSSSAMETRDFGSDDDHKPPTQLDPGRHIDRSEALTLCKELNMEGVNHLIEQIFTQNSTTELTVADFFRKLDAELASTIQEVQERSNTNIVPSLESTNKLRLSSVNIIEAWENSGVPRPRTLLTELGFRDDVISPSDLENVLDEEIRTLSSPVNERSLLLNAALAVSRLQVKLSLQHVDSAMAERDKLRADVADANARARLLAQEIDESHARLEAELKSNLKRAEARHTEATRAAAAEIAVERERNATLSTRLQDEIKRRTDIETKSKLESAELRSRLEEAEARLHTAEERHAEIERERTSLQAALRAAEGAASGGGRGSGTGESLNGAEADSRMERLRLENLQLRDRNDELCAMLEARRCDTAAPPPPPPPPRPDHLSAELGSLLGPSPAEEYDSSPTSLDQKVFGHLEAVEKLRDLLEKMKTISETRSNCDVCANILETVGTLKEKILELTEATLVAEPPLSNICENSSQTESQDELIGLTTELAECREERNRLQDLIKDFELSLEQMKCEYDKSEEYWSGKLEEERRAAAEEQRAADTRLADLLARVTDYERQYALPPIDERPRLEAQVNDLQDEFARYRRDKEAELARLRTEAAQGGGGGGTGGGGAGRRELRARAARAEAAVRRLQARLAAADVLVRDLYVENCQLVSRDRL